MRIARDPGTPPLVRIEHPSGVYSARVTPPSTRTI
jgi:hypothetical protein